MEGASLRARVRMCVCARDVHACTPMAGSARPAVASQSHAQALQAPCTHHFWIGMKSGTFTEPCAAVCSNLSGRRTSRMSLQRAAGRGQGAPACLRAQATGQGGWGCPGARQAGRPNATASLAAPCGLGRRNGAHALGPQRRQHRLGPVRALIHEAWQDEEGGARAHGCGWGGPREHVALGRSRASVPGCLGPGGAYLRLLSHTALPVAASASSATGRAARTAVGVRERGACKRVAAAAWLLLLLLLAWLVAWWGLWRCIGEQCGVYGVRGRAWAWARVGARGRPKHSKCAPASRLDD